MPKTFKEGEKIWLKADEEEGWKRQEAVFVGYEDPPYSDMAIVEVKPEEPGDDGIREVPINQIEEETEDSE